MIEIDLKDKVAIVTGVSSGIGAGVAKMLAKAGCHVAGCGFSGESSEGAQKFIASVEGEARQAFYFSCDITKRDEIHQFVDETIAHFGQLDIVISSAGRNMFKGVKDCSVEDWDYNIRLNFESHWVISQKCWPHLMKSKNGFILIMTSNHAYTTIPGCFPYNITKTGLTGMVRAMAIEWGPHIRVVGLAPGFIDTNGGDTWFKSFDDPEAERQKTIGRHPSGRFGTVTEVGAFCSFLASDYAKFITGVTYLMDGGRSALMQDD
jgi:NAD(P)-dependent dehydrogenase (short-subunit alcohol dehydrogenase family)